MFQTINHYSQDMLYVDIFIDEEYKLFMARPGIPLLGGGARGKGAREGGFCTGELHKVY